ncbi:MAG: FlgO family outer membrane protein [Thermodesulfobacteriota bacterium]|nr:FlgO family outer membrane protein [Thermodesulfobacteriota bacterium]
MYRLLIMIVILPTLLLSNSNITMAYEKEIKSISSTIAASISKSGKKTIAVVDFTDLQGNVTELGRFLAEELSVDLTTVAQGFEVIDRTHLKTILAEHKLSISGLIDPNTVKKLGQIAEVDAIITGSITPFGDSIRATVKVIATDTAKMIGAAKGDIDKTKAIEELLARGIETGQPLSVAAQSNGSSSSKSARDGNRPFFESTVLRIDVVSFEQSGPYFHLLMKHTNKANQTLVLRAFEHRDSTFLQDDNNMQFNYVTTYAAGRNDELELSDRGRLIELPPSGSKVISFNFARSSAAKGRRYSFSSKYGYCISNGRCFPYNPLFISIKGIQLQ